MSSEHEEFAGKPEQIPWTQMESKQFSSNVHGSPTDAMFVDGVDGGS